MSVLLLGGTDLTLAVGDCLRALGIEIGGLVYIGERFDISYAPAGVTNTRAVDAAAWCDERGIAGHTYTTVDEAEQLVAERSYELALAAGWYHMVPRRLRERFPRGCIGVHASLLPKLRGGAPLNWALLAGERETGVTVFELADGVDDGPIYGQRAFPIKPRATIADLLALAEAVTLGLVEEVVPALLAGTIAPVPQSGAPTYCLQRRAEDGTIDWRRSAAEIDALVRAVGRPYPGARATLEGDVVYVWAAEPLNAPPVLGVPGQIASLPDTPGPLVVTGNGTLTLRDVTDREGRSVLDDLRRAANRCFDVTA